MNTSTDKTTETEVFLRLTAESPLPSPAPPNQHVGITDPCVLCSYNHILLSPLTGSRQRPPATPLLVPGLPAVWEPPPDPTILPPGAPPVEVPLPPDRARPYIDQSSYHSPRYPFLPAITALVHTKPSYLPQDHDFIACRNSIRKLLGFLVPCKSRPAKKTFGDQRGWILTAHAAYGTVWIVRREVEAVEGRREFLGFSDAFMRENTNWDRRMIWEVTAEAKKLDSTFNSVRTTDGREYPEPTSHHRLISYDFAGLKCLVRFEANMYICHESYLTSEKPTGERSRIATRSKPAFRWRGRYGSRDWGDRRDRRGGHEGREVGRGEGRRGGRGGRGTWDGGHVGRRRGGGGRGNLWPDSSIEFREGEGDCEDGRPSSNEGRGGRGGRGAWRPGPNEGRGGRGGRRPGPNEGRDRRNSSSDGAVGGGVDSLVSGLHRLGFSTLTPVPSAPAMPLPPVPPPADSPTSFTVFPIGRTIPQRMVGDIKTRVFHKSLAASDYVARAWISQTPVLVRGWWKDEPMSKVGTNIVRTFAEFNDVRVERLDFPEYEKENQELLSKLHGFLAEIIRVAKEHGVVVLQKDPGGNEIVLRELDDVETAAWGGDVLPSEMVDKFRDPDVKWETESESTDDDWDCETESEGEAV